MAKGIEIVITAEKLFTVGGVGIANTLFTSLLVSGLLLTFLIIANRKLSATKYPTGLQNFLEMVVEFLYGMVEGVAGRGKKALVFAPIISAFFVFILLNNWIEHLPGFHTILFTGEPGVQLVHVPKVMLASPAFASTVEKVEATTGQEVSATEEISAEASAAEAEVKEEGHGTALLRGANADLNMTLALALISVVLTQFFGLRYAGLGYLKKFFNFSSPINVFVGILELVGEFSKIISFSFRLFGNIFAGEVLIAVMGFLLPVFLPIPFIAFELFIGGLQAYVFAMLSLVFFTMASSEEAHH
jgi:F-type H+-transporting ATPase subunit a